MPCGPVDWLRNINFLDVCNPALSVAKGDMCEGQRGFSLPRLWCPIPKLCRDVSDLVLVLALKLNGRVGELDLCGDEPRCNWLPLLISGAILLEFILTSN